LNGPIKFLAIVGAFSLVRDLSFAVYDRAGVAGADERIAAALAFATIMVMGLVAVVFAINLVKSEDSK
jgi:hypothetical protein